MVRILRFVLLLAVLTSVPTLASPGPTNASAVHTVHLVISHHLDVGLALALRFEGNCNGFATKVIQVYFDDFIPRAIKLAKEINVGIDSPTDNGRFAYTIHPWIANLYVDCVPWYIEDGCKHNPGQLRCPSDIQVSDFDAAVRRGDLLWADSPMDMNAGIVGEPGMFESLFDIAGTLNERYNLTKKDRVWSNIDVPGFTRSGIPLLLRSGATALSICANVGGRGNGAVPAEFVGGNGTNTNNASMWRWYDPVSDKEILVLYHKAQRDTVSKIPLSSEFNTYAGFTRPDNTIITPGGVALASYVASDNTGPPLSVAAVKRIFKTVRSVFPNAKTVFGSTWDRFVSEITPAEVAALPRYSSEWGDQWVTGMGNDPGRLAKYRAILRARAACIASGKCQPRDPVLRNFTRFAAKNAEHTQGEEGGGMAPGSQICIWLALINVPCPTDSDWTNEEFNRIHTAKKNYFPTADDSWLEGRLFNSLAIQAVPASHPLATFLEIEIAGLVPRGKKSNPAKAKRPSLLSPDENEFGPTVECHGTVLSFSKTGSLSKLVFRGGESWSELMDLRYVTYRGAGKKGMVCNEPKCPNPIPGAWVPSLLGFSSTANDANQSCHIVLELGFNDTLHKKYGAPASVTAEYNIDPEQKQVNMTFTWHNKTTTRLLEALMVFNRPMRGLNYHWEMDKLGEWVSPANVTSGGEQYMHAVWTGIRYTKIDAPAAGLWLSTLDAGLVCPVLNKHADQNLTPESSLEKACFDYHVLSRSDPSCAQATLNDTMIDGMGVNLHANRFTISGFPQWYPFGVGDLYQKQDETTQFRFVLEEK